VIIFLPLAIFLCVHRAVRIDTGSISRPHNDFEAITRIRYLVQLCTSNSHDSIIILTSLLNKHSQRCDLPECECSSLLKKSSGIGKSEPIILNFSAYLTLNELNPYFFENWKLRVLKVLTNELSKKFSKSDEVIMFLSQIYYLYLGNQYQSLVFISTIESHNPPLLARLVLYYARLIINIGMLNLAEKSVLLLDSLEYQSYFKKFLKIADQISENTIKFWATLLNDNPDMSILNTIGITLFNSRKDLIHVVEKINKICSNNIEFLVKYGLYMKYIVNDSYTASASFNSILRSMDRIRRAKTNGNTFSVLQSDVRNMMVVISIETKDFMQIIDINSEAEQILNSKRHEIIGKSISHIMPPMIGEVHEKFMQQFFKTMKSDILNTKMLVWIKNRDGLYCACDILKNFVPRLTGGFLGIMFAHLNKQIPDYTQSKKDLTINRVGSIICDENLKIVGFSIEASKLMTMPERIVAEIVGKYTLDYLFPEISLIKGLDEFTSPAGKILEFQAKNFVSESENLDINMNFLIPPAILMWVRLIKETYGNIRSSYILLFSPILPTRVRQYVRVGDSNFFVNSIKSSGEQKKVDLELMKKTDEQHNPGTTVLESEDIDFTNNFSVSGSASSTNKTSSSQSSQIAKEMLDRALANETPSSIKKLLAAIIALFIVVVTLIGIF